MIGKTNVKVKPNEKVNYIEYIESTGTQYIDTGVKTGINIKMVSEFAITGEAGEVNINGAVYSSNAGWFMQGVYADSNLWSCYATSTRQGCTIPFDNEYHNYITANGFQQIDDTVTNYSTSSMPSTLNIYLFARSINFEGSMGTMKMKLKSCQIYENDVLIRDFRPVLDGAGVYCLYDKVYKRFYYNQGTGNFKGEGWTVTELEYIESTGTQYIDTGYKPNQNTRVELGYQLVTKPTSNMGVFGQWTKDNMSRLYYNANNKSYSIQYGSTTYNNLSIPTDDTLVNIDLNKNVLKVNNTVINTLTSKTFTSSASIFLFGTHSAETGLEWANDAVSRISYCKIYENDVLLHDYIGVVDQSSVVCLYDKVDDTFLYNAGTGEFIGGVAS